MTMAKPNSSSTFGKTASGNSSTPESINQQKLYIFTPAGLDVKLTLSLLLATASVIGFVGNICVLRFISKDKKKFSNLNFFIRGLAISDVLGALVGTPLLLIQFYFDVFQSKWPCRISRYFQILFPVITIYNLLVVALERYICTCHPTSRPLSLASVKKAVKGAWLLGFLVTLLPASTFKGLRVELNGTHYTVICKYDNSDHLNRVMFPMFTVLAYIVPIGFLGFTCTAILRVVWKRTPHIIVSLPAASLALRQLRLKQRKATILLIAINLAFLIPYFLYFSYSTFNITYKPSISFRSDYALRYTGAILAYVNGSVNFFIHLVQLPAFRSTLTNDMCCGKYETNITLHTSVGERRNRKGLTDQSPVRNEHSCVRRASMSDMEETKRDYKFRVRNHSI